MSRIGLVYQVSSEVDSNIGSGKVSLYWIPVGSGCWPVKASSMLFELSSALRHLRTPRKLYHSALIVEVPEGKYIIEQAPVWDLAEYPKETVGEGAVGCKWLRKIKLFRYEVRCWKNGIIPDISYAVESPITISEQPETAYLVLEALRSVPLPVWGRDELNAGEMWNSNSVISWVLCKSGVVIESIRIPKCGRALGWCAGIIVARRT